MSTSKSKKSTIINDDENVRYKINEKYFEKLNDGKLNDTEIQKGDAIRSNVSSKTNDDSTVLYKFPDNNVKVEKKVKLKPKIKVNFWSNKFNNKQISNKIRPKKMKILKVKLIREKPVVSVVPNKSQVVTVNPVAKTSPKNTSPKNSNQKVRKTVSVLPSPLFTDEHAPMVTVPDDLTIQLDQDEADDLLGGLDLESSPQDVVSSTQGKQIVGTPSIVLRGAKKRGRSEDHGDSSELEFFSKYIVQKLRKLDTNQRIYAENLINTVLMYGQLHKLSGKTKIE